MSELIDQFSTNVNQITYRRKEDFDINEIVFDKYDMRKNRSQRSIDDLAENIRLRGQIEYVHIAIIENKYHLLAGYTRYFALKKLGRKTIRAILYTNLSEEEIQSIITGTNDLRIDPTNWDKICNIANFHINNPEIPLYTSKSKSEKTLCTIFGLNKSMIYNHIGAYELISKNKILKVFIEVNPDLFTPLFAGLYSVKKLIKSDDDTRIIIDILKNGHVATQADFVNYVKNVLGKKSHTLSKSHENQKWRKSETYLKGQLENISGVVKVIDVSKQDTGYDFEVRCKNGDIYYVEAKKVSSLDESFKMTDRERSFAISEKEKYILALVVMPDEEIKYIRYIQNPMNKIEYERVIEKVSWKSGNYDKHVISEIHFL